MKNAKDVANEEESEGLEVDEVEAVQDEDEERPPLLTRCGPGWQDQVPRRKRASACLRC